MKTIIFFLSCFRTGFVRVTGTCLIFVLSAAGLCAQSTNTVRDFVKSRMQGFEINSISDESPEADALVRKYSRGEYPDNILAQLVFAEARNPLSFARYRMALRSGTVEMGRALQSYLEDEFIEKTGLTDLEDFEVKNLIAILVSQSVVKNTRTVMEIHYNGRNPETGEERYGFFAYLSCQIPDAGDIDRAFAEYRSKGSINSFTSGKRRENNHDDILSLRDIVDGILGDDEGIKDFRNNVRKLRALD